MLRTMPQPLRKTLALHRDHLTCEQIAASMNISRWVVRWRMRGVAGYLMLKSKTFEEWLYSTASRHLWSS
jgi:hypothetical protein